MAATAIFTLCVTAPVQVDSVDDKTIPARDSEVNDCGFGLGVRILLVTSWANQQASVDDEDADD